MTSFTKHQRGFFDISGGELLAFFIVVVLVGGWVVYVAIPWAWQILKPFVHRWTA